MESDSTLSPQSRQVDWGAVADLAMLATGSDAAAADALAKLQRIERGDEPPPLLEDA